MTGRVDRKTSVIPSAARGTFPGPQRSLATLGMTILTKGLACRPPARNAEIAPPSQDEPKDSQQSCELKQVHKFHLTLRRNVVAYVGRSNRKERPMPLTEINVT